MVANAIFVTALLFLGGGIFLMGELRFLVPYRSLLLTRYGLEITLYLGALFLNVFTLVLSIGRTLRLKDTGRKLAYLEQQLGTDQSVSAELAERIKR